MVVSAPEWGGWGRWRTCLDSRCRHAALAHNLAAAQAGLVLPGLGYEAVPWYQQFDEFVSKNPSGLVQVGHREGVVLVSAPAGIRWGYRWGRRLDGLPPHLVVVGTWWFGLEAQPKVLPVRSAVWTLIRWPRPACLRLDITTTRLATGELSVWPRAHRHIAFPCGSDSIHAWFEKLASFSWNHERRKSTEAMR